MCMHTHTDQKKKRVWEEIHRMSTAKKSEHFRGSDGNEEDNLGRITAAETRNEAKLVR